jgi:drug/metabolite transporter (DMT)-like permease
MFLFSALVAGSFSLGAQAARFVSPEAFTVLRFAIAGALVGAVAFATTGQRAIALRAPWRYAVLGALLAAYFVLMFEGLRTAAAVSTSAVFTLTPLMAALFGYIVLRQIPSKRMVFALIIGGIGAIWVVFRGSFSALQQLEIGHGEAIYFVGCTAHALYAPMVRKLNRGESAVVFTFGTMMGGLILLGIWGWRDVISTPWHSLPGIVWVCLAYVSVAASALTFVLLQYSTLRLPSAKVMAYTYLVPFWVIVWETVSGQPLPQASIWFGLGLTLFALALLLKDEEKVNQTPTNIR